MNVAQMYAKAFADPEVCFGLTAALLINLVSKQIYFRCERFVRMSLAMSASDAAALVIYGF